MNKNKVLLADKIRACYQEGIHTTDSLYEEQEAIVQVVEAYLEEVKKEVAESHLKNLYYIKSCRSEEAVFNAIEESITSMHNYIEKLNAIGEK